MNVRSKTLPRRLFAFLLSPLSSIHDTPTRFLVPLLIVGCSKLLGGLIVYHLLNMGLSDTYWMTVEWGHEGQNEILRSGLNGSRWLYLFWGWDSAWYLSIVEKGYSFSDQSFAFFPGLPLFSRLVNVFFQNSFLATTVFATFVGMLWIPIYQLIAEIYMDRSQALKSTLFFAFLPPIFLFTTVVYSEGLFLSSTLGTWYYWKRERPLHSMVFASIAAISRPPGLIILFPLCLDTLKKSLRGRSLKRRYFLYFTLPILSFATWLFYCQITVNDWLAPFNRTAWNVLPSLVTLIRTPLFSSSTQLLDYNHVWLFVLLPPLLILLLGRMEKVLVLYSAGYYFGTLVFGALISTPRFISFLFPIWLPLSLKLFGVKQSALVLIVLCTAFWILGLSLWYGFLNGGSIF